MSLKMTQLTGKSAIVSWMEIKPENRLLENVFKTEDLKIS